MVTVKRSKESLLRYVVLTCALMLVIGGLLFCPGAIIAQDVMDSYAVQISEINSLIQQKGGQWVAGETSVSKLSLTEKKKLLGLIQPALMSDEEMVTFNPPQTTLAPSLDWRNNGGNFVTPIRNQGGCGSCWAFATTAALESATLIYNNSSGVDLDLSEQVLLSCSGAGNCQQGGYIGSAAIYIQSTGLPFESCYPYTGTNGDCSSACANWQSSTYKISNWNWVTTSAPTVNALKNALTYGPLVTTFSVYNDFYNYSGGIYSHTSGGYLGGHAVLLIGYDDPGQYFVVKNSWGAGWGESGYFRIAYSELNSVVKFGAYTIAYGSAIPPNSETVSSPTTLTGSSSGVAGTSYTYTTGGSSSSQSHSVQYIFDWNDGTTSGMIVTACDAVVLTTLKFCHNLPCMYTE